MVVLRDSLLPCASDGVVVVQQQGGFSGLQAVSHTLTSQWCSSELASHCPKRSHTYSHLQSAYARAAAT